MESSGTQRSRSGIGSRLVCIPLRAAVGRKAASSQWGVHTPERKRVYPTADKTQDRMVHWMVRGAA